MSDIKCLYSVIIVHIEVFGIFYSDKKLAAHQETADTFHFHFVYVPIYNTFEINTNFDFITFDKRSPDSKNDDGQKTLNRTKEIVSTKTYHNINKRYIIFLLRMHSYSDQSMLNYYVVHLK